MTHATLIKFGYPNSLVFEADHWCVVLRPQQITLGSLVLVAKSHVQSFAALPDGAYAQLQHVTGKIERALKSVRSFDKINYIMLMMVDPEVHFHVVPRYAAMQTFEGVTFSDSGWPGQPDFKSFTTLSIAQREALQVALVKAFATL